MQMNLPGSAIGAWRRALAAGTVTHSLMERTASSAAAPPSRKPRVLCGTRAAAISRARTTPRRVRVAARLASRSATRSPRSAPRRGDWSLVEKRTSFMASGLPTEIVANYSLSRIFAPRAEFSRREPFEICWVSPDAEAHPRPGGHPMRLATRSTAFAVVVSLLGSGPLATFARPQQPAQPPAQQPAPQPEQPAQPPDPPPPQPA